MEKNNNINNTLWKISNDLRGNMDSTKFKDYILGFIFYNFLSHNVEAAILEIDDKKSFEELYKEHPEDVRSTCINAVGYFIEPDKMFSKFVEKYEGGELSLDEIQEALNAIENSTTGTKSQGDFQGLFDDLNLYSHDLGRDASDKIEMIGKIIKELSAVDFEFDNPQNDVLGDAYEYMIGQFASNAGKKAGEFYTPQSVAKILTKIVSADRTNIKTIYDPTCGSGSLLLRVSREFDIKKIEHLYGEELNTSTYNLARMNMLIHKVKYDQFTINNTNTLEKPTFLDKKFDAIVANPPFSANWSSDEHHLEAPRFRDFAKLAPKGKADFAFVQHMLYQVKEEGVIATVLPHGPLFRGAAEGSIREQLLKNNNIDAVIGLPQNLFFGTSIQTIILILKKCKNDDKVLFIDASNEFEKIKTQNVLNDSHIEKIIKTYKERKDIEKYSRLVTLEEIKENDYNLNIPRYVDTFEEEEPIDLDKVMKDLKQCQKEQKDIKELINKDLKELGLEPLE